MASASAEPRLPSLVRTSPPPWPARPGPRPRRHRLVVGPAGRCRPRPACRRRDPGPGGRGRAPTADDVALPPWGDAVLLVGLGAPRVAAAPFSLTVPGPRRARSAGPSASRWRRRRRRYRTPPRRCPVGPPGWTTPPQPGWPATTSRGRLERSLAQPHPPLQMVLEWLSRHLFGLSPLALRLPSLVAGVLLVPRCTPPPRALRPADGAGGGRWSRPRPGVRVAVGRPWPGGPHRSPVDHRPLSLSSGRCAGRPARLGPCSAWRRRGSSSPPAGSGDGRRPRPARRSSRSSGRRQPPDTTAPRAGVHPITGHPAGADGRRAGARRRQSPPRRRFRCSSPGTASVPPPPCRRRSTPPPPPRRGAVRRSRWWDRPWPGWSASTRPASRPGSWLCGRSASWPPSLVFGRGGRVGGSCWPGWPPRRSWR